MLTYPDFLAHGFNVFNPFIANGIGQGAKQIVAILHALGQFVIDLFVNGLLID
jgi:hypothetical protein